MAETERLSQLINLQKTKENEFVEKIKKNEEEIKNLQDLLKKKENLKNEEPNMESIKRCKNPQS